MTLPPPNFHKRNRDLRLHSPQHLAFIRKRLCAVFFQHDCEGKVEACHLRELSPEKGMGARPSDLFTVGMCRRHHRESEKRERDFQAEHGVDLLSMALDYGEASPDKRVKTAATAIRSLMKMSMSQDEFAKMVEAVLKKIREQEMA